MRNIHTSVLEAIGETPMIQLERFGARVEPTLLAKLEFTNPGGSMKDRAALGMVEWAEREHALQPQDEIIVSTSGNLGLGMAMVCAVKGYRLTCLVDPKVNPSTERCMQLLGAELVKVDEQDHTGGYHLSRLDRLESLQKERPRAVYLDQYDCQAAIDAHRTTTGPEIFAQVEGKLDAIVMATGTGGSSMGVAQFLRKHSPKTEIWLVDEKGSLALPDNGGAAPRFLNGLGTSIAPANFGGAEVHQYVDHIVYVNAEESIAAAAELALSEGILVGGSGGAVVHVMKNLVASNFQLGSTILSLIPDHGSRYTQTQFDPEWLCSMGLDVPSVTYSTVVKQDA
jgi:cysteine synthase